MTSVRQFGGNDTKLSDCESAVMSCKRLSNNFTPTAELEPLGLLTTGRSSSLTHTAACAVPPCYFSAQFAQSIKYLIREK
jgi:hypothetical protein